MSVEQIGSTAKLSVRNIGGINETEVTFEPGVTVLAGRNATNRTSLLQAIMAALGSDNISMKADADKAYVELTLDGETYTRTLERQNSTVHLSGQPYLEDSTLADLFAFLLESNEARRAVVTEANLRDIIMQPVDTDEIQAEIDQLLDERRQISDELNELKDLKGRLPNLEEQRTQLQAEIDETTEELEEIESEIEAHDENVEESQDEQESLESLRTEKREVEETYDDLTETSGDDLEDLKTRIGRLRTKKQQLETELTDIQSVIGFNQDQLEEGTETFAEVFDDDDDGTVTDELLPEETVTCWTCGNEVDTGEIETTIETLQDLSQEHVAEITDLEDEFTKLTNQRQDLEEQQRRREQLERRRDDLKTELAETETRIEELSDRRDALRTKVEAIEADVDSLESNAYTEILNLHKEANQLEYDLGKLENDRERIEENITTIEKRLNEEAELKTQRNEVTDEIKELRTRIEQIEKQAIEEFNGHMETVLELLEYENLARIWIERRETEIREGRSKVTKSVFDLHIVRQTESGASYEDSIGNLSESEREVTGLLFALSGYLTHDVYEAVPFMLLDSVEAIDSGRIAPLVEYIEEYCDNLIVALLPEDANTLAEEYHYVPKI